MKKSKSVPAKLVCAVAAVLISGCHSGPTEVRRCTDDKGNILPDSMCTGTGGGYYGGSSYYGGSGYYSRPHWVYGGSVSGSHISGFHSSPSPGASVSDSAGHSVSRGGFGSHGGSDGGAKGGS